MSGALKINTDSISKWKFSFFKKYCNYTPQQQENYISHRREHINQAINTAQSYYAYDLNRWAKEASCLLYSGRHQEKPKGPILSKTLLIPVF